MFRCLHDDLTRLGASHSFRTVPPPSQGIGAQAIADALHDGRPVPFKYLSDLKDHLNCSEPEVARSAYPLVEQAGRVLDLLDPFALLAFKRGRIGDAARMLGRADMRYAMGNYQRELVEQKLRDKLMFSLRDAMSPDELSRLMKEGEALNDEDSARLALGIGLNVRCRVQTASASLSLPTSCRRQPTAVRFFFSGSSNGSVCAVAAAFSLLPRISSLAPAVLGHGLCPKR